MAQQGQHMSHEEALKETTLAAGHPQPTGTVEQIAQQKLDHAKALYDAGVTAGTELHGGERDTWQDTSGQALEAAGDKKALERRASPERQTEPDMTSVQAVKDTMDVPHLDSKLA
eukprot:jgi/Mesen1/3939/ME000209S02937